MSGYNCHKTEPHNCDSPHCDPQSEVKPLDDAEIEEVRERCRLLNPSADKERMRGLLATIDSLKRTNEAQAQAIAAVKALCDEENSIFDKRYWPERLVTVSKIEAALESVERES